MKTHVTKYRPLIADRTAWNKLWRRSFWDRHGFRFPEGRLFEDSPVTVPAHFLAASVDVIADPVYHWRIREDGELSITQRRLDPRSLRDRMTAIEEVSERLAADGPRGAKRWYDESVVADDLRYYVNALEGADDDYMALFMDRVNAFLDGASDRIYKPLPAIERLKWYLVRHRLVPELLEVLRFQKQDIGAHAARADARHVVRRLPVPHRQPAEDPALGLPAQGTHELWVRAGLDRLRARRRQARAARARVHHRHRLRIRGRPAREPVGAAARAAAARPAPAHGRSSCAPGPTHRPDVAANARQALCDLSWCGFEATLDPSDLRRLGRQGRRQVGAVRHRAGGRRPAPPLALHRRGPVAGPQRTWSAACARR